MTVSTREGRAITPTGIEWLLAFAIHGCQWAIDDLDKIQPNLYKALQVERQLFDWERWGTEQMLMVFYDVILKVRIGDHQPGSKFPIAAINFDVNQLQLYPEVDDGVFFTYSIELRL